LAIFTAAAAATRPRRDVLWIPPRRTLVVHVSRDVHVAAAIFVVLVVVRVNVIPLVIDDASATGLDAILISVATGILLVVIEAVVVAVVGDISRG